MKMCGGRWLGDVKRDLPVGHWAVGFGAGARREGVWSVGEGSSARIADASLYVRTGFDGGGAFVRNGGPDSGGDWGWVVDLSVGPGRTPRAGAGVMRKIRGSADGFGGCVPGGDERAVVELQGDHGRCGRFQGVPTAGAPCDSADGSAMAGRLSFRWVRSVVAKYATTEEALGRLNIAQRRRESRGRDAL